MIKMLVLAPVSIDAAELLKAVENALDGAAKDVKIDFQTTTRTWNNRPEFAIEKAHEGRLIYTGDEIYHIVNVGAKPHRIEPVNAKMLAFKVGGFRPKTRVGFIGSNKGASGKQLVFSMGVNHPGHDAREFDTAIQKKWIKLFPNILQRAIDAAVERSVK